MEGPDAKKPKLDPRPVDNTLTARPNFISTVKYKEIADVARKETVCILHVHGFPGTGKSEIIRTVASEFPYTSAGSSAGLYAKWHVQCDDNNHDIETELVNMLIALKENNILLCDYRSVENELKRGKTKPLMTMLSGLAIPILILIEDPQKSVRQEMLSDLLTQVNGLNVGEPSCKFHLYLTSRKNSVSMPSAQLKQGLRCYKSFQVDGFTDEEGLEMLFGGDNEPEREEREAGLKIIELNSRSPLGLVAVKANCVNSRSTYTEYLEFLRDNRLEAEVQEMEAHHLREEYGGNFMHLFRSIVLLLQSKPEDDEIYQQIWRVVNVLSFFHHGQLPQLLVARVAQQQRTKFRDDVRRTATLNKASSGNVITHLENYGICKIDGSGYLRTTVTFHEVVFRAVRVMLKLNDKEQSDHYTEQLKTALYSLSGIVHKDLRKSQDNIFMNKISSQIETLLPHLKKSFDLSGTHGTLSSEQFVIQMCTCHLLEVLGIVKSLGVFSSKSFAEECLTSAATLILDMVNSLVKDKGIEAAKVFTPSDNPDETARDIVSNCTKAGETLFRELPEGTIDNYMALVLQMKSTEIDFLQSRAANSDHALFSSAKEASETRVGLTSSLMCGFRGCQGAFLDRKSHCSMFFAERLSSILHTFGRVLLYYNVPVTAAMRRKYEWYSKLAHAVALESGKNTELRILFERLTTISLVPIMLKALNGRPSEEKKATLTEAKSLLQRLMESGEDEKVDFYEHGHVKETEGAVYDRMILRRFLIRVNTKLMALEGRPDPESVAQGDKVHDQLYRLASDNIAWIMAPKCLVYCGKYLACKGKYQDAAKCFVEALEAGIAQSTNLYAWACYNYTRAVVSGNLDEHFGAAKSRCKEVLEKEEETDADLVEKIKVCLRQLPER